MSKLLYFVSIGILAFWILRCESLAVNDEETQLITLSDSSSFYQQILAQVSAPPSSDSPSPSAEVPEKSNTVANLIKSTDPEEREKSLKQNLENQLDSITTDQSVSETIFVPRTRDPFSVVPQIPVPELTTQEESSVGQLPEIQGQQLPSLPTLPETKSPVTWQQQNARRIVPSDDSLDIAQQGRRRPSPATSVFEPRNSVFVERGC